MFIKFTKCIVLLCQTVFILFLFVACIPQLGSILIHLPTVHMADLFSFQSNCLSGYDGLWMWYISITCIILWRVAAVSVCNASFLHQRCTYWIAVTLKTEVQLKSFKPRVLCDKCYLWCMHVCVYSLIIARNLVPNLRKKNILKAFRLFICKAPSRRSLGLTLTLPCIKTPVEIIIKISVFASDFFRPLCYH